MQVDDIKLKDDDYFDCDECGRLIDAEEVKVAMGEFVCPDCGNKNIDYFEG